jgi:hypothetical protein
MNKTILDIYKSYKLKRHRQYKKTDDLRISQTLRQLAYISRIQKSMLEQQIESEKIKPQLVTAYKKYKK